MSILAIGHSARTLEGFLGILRAHNVSRIVDVRTIPRSKRNPQFNQNILSENLKESGICRDEVAGRTASSEYGLSQYELEKSLLSRFR